MLSYDNWCKAGLSTDELPRELQGIYRCLDQYFKEKQDGSNDTIGVADLSNLYFSTNPRDREYAIRIFDQLERVDVSSETTETLIRGLRRAKLLRELSLASYEAVEGRASPDKVNDLMARLAELDAGTQRIESEASEGVFVTDDLEVLVNSQIKTSGLRWRLKTLNKMLGSLRKGNFGFIFARPETGKTTFLASECTFMAEQLKEDSGPIVWFNNEQEGETVMLRCIQAALGLPLMELLRDIEKYKRQFRELIKGKILIVDDAGITKQRVEAICKRYKPSLVVFDQIDKIYGFDNDREDLRLGSIYIWARELAKLYCPVIGVCQADGQGEGVRWLTMAHVANAKTSKQAEADWIVGIGKVHDAGYESLRFLNVSKNKLLGDEDTVAADRHGKKQVLLNADIARYEDLE